MFSMVVILGEISYNFLISSVTLYYYYDARQAKIRITDKVLDISLFRVLYLIIKKQNPSWDHFLSFYPLGSFTQKLIEILN